MQTHKKVFAHSHSAVMKQCRVCGNVKHLSAFTQTVSNYCNSICNHCYSEQLARKKSRLLFEESKQESDVFSSEHDQESPTETLLSSPSSSPATEPELECTSRDDWSYFNRPAVPYSKWIIVNPFFNDVSHVYVAKAISQPSYCSL